MKAAALLVLGFLAMANAVKYPVLEDYDSLYNVLNETGWKDYPQGCWLFPLPAINVVVDDRVWLLSAQAGPEDKSGGATVAKAWCKQQGFRGVGEWKLQDFSESQAVNTIDIATEETCEAVGKPGGAALKCSALKYVECIKGSATSGCSRRFTSNNGVDNMGYGNGGVGLESGSTNVGNFNNGSTNLGDWNIGSANVGSLNQGSANYGSCLVGSALKGSFDCAALM